MNEIKKLLDSDKLVFGKDRVIKGLKNGEFVKVFLASNINSESLEDVERYASLSNAELEHLKFPNDELGTFCKKPFSVSVIGLLK